MNDHGWKPLGSTTDGAAVWFGASADAQHRLCACPRDACQRDATQEDLLCDECRKECQ